MGKLTLESFTSGYKDLETKQYEILTGLKEHYERFSHNRLYPGLGELIQLVESLEHLLHSYEDLQQRMPHAIADLDIEQKKLVFQSSDKDLPQLGRMVDLIAWSLPLLRKAIEEGTTIYNFVDEHITIEEVGILPVYRQEGYWFVPDLQAELLHLLRYELSLFTASNERYRTLKTVLLESLTERTIKRSPESVKLQLLNKYRDLPNPATYRCQVDVEFPFQETVMPVAKRKLMAYLVS